MLLADAMRHAPPVTAPARTLLREEIYARIREWIVEGVLPPDTRLRDTEIAEALAVSRMPVREALRRLEDEGLVVAGLADAIRTPMGPLSTIPFRMVGLLVAEATAGRRFKERE